MTASGWCAAAPRYSLIQAHSPAPLLSRSLEALICARLDLITICSIQCIAIPGTAYRPAPAATYPHPPSPFVCVLVPVAAARRRSLAFDLRCLIGVHTSFSPSCVDIMTMRHTVVSSSLPFSSYCTCQIDSRTKYGRRPANPVVDLC